MRAYRHAVYNRGTAAIGTTTFLSWQQILFLQPLDSCRCWEWTTALTVMTPRSEICCRSNAAAREKFSALKPKVPIHVPTASEIDRQERLSTISASVSASQLAMIIVASDACGAVGRSHSRLQACDLGDRFESAHAGA
jgi:hypothetical protein